MDSALKCAPNGTPRQEQIALAVRANSISEAMSAHGTKRTVRLRRVGAWSGQLARQLGTHIPLESERGYRVMIVSAATGLRIQTISAERKFVAAPMEEGLRLSGMVEFAGLKAKPNMTWADALLRQGQHMFPALDASRVKRWMGNRPGTPDSIAVIAQSLRHANVIFAFGHGHQGMIGGVPCDS